MLCEVISAGFGGQGILFLGDALARAGLREGKFVTYMPTYGVAMRGGTANCVVHISDEEIGCPLLDHPHVGVILNEASLLKFQPAVRKGGLIIANSSMIDKTVLTRNGDVKVIWVPATELAREVAGTERSTNMIMLGAFLGAQPVVAIDTIEAILRENSGGSKKALLEKNFAALRAGKECAAGA
ncbi:MAG TPA: 2-oxoacid:acceptor oxidoreductase family protein [Candidatus Hydrogenedentes bacterium]|nr:2-oxoacid:acceptor oxidoreductase family protein [Candidatus Hydrogenedentota bacterium]HPG70093.1 2-oxoacid:acceptor oxidoreductase family protein [Candidatus Hydrogenedentota bacterium]